MSSRGESRAETKKLITHSVALLALAMVGACGGDNADGTTDNGVGAMTAGSGALTAGTMAGGTAGDSSNVGTSGSSGGIAGTTMVGGAGDGSAGTTMGNAGTSSAGTMGNAGDGGGSGVSGGAGVEGSAGTAAPPECKKGETKGSQVVMIGDSYLALSGDVTTVLTKLAKDAGAPTPYRTYYVSGTSLGNGQIPGQFDQAVTANKDIKFVIMDGGGNDILLLNSMCLSLTDPGSNASCKKSVDTSVATGTKLLDKMGDSGVEQVVWFFYPDLNPGLLAGSMPNNINDYGIPRMKEMCESNTSVACHFIDIRPAFKGKTAQYIGVDGVHPTLAGSTVIANLVWDEMKADCIAQ